MLKRKIAMVAAVDMNGTWSPGGPDILGKSVSGGSTSKANK